MKKNNQVNSIILVEKSKNDFVFVPRENIALVTLTYNPKEDETQSWFVRVVVQYRQMATNACVALVLNDGIAENFINDYYGTL